VLRSKETVRGNGPLAQLPADNIHTCPVTSNLEFLRLERKRRPKRHATVKALRGEYIVVDFLCHAAPRLSYARELAAATRCRAGTTAWRALGARGRPAQLSFPCSCVLRSPKLTVPSRSCHLAVPAGRTLRATIYAVWGNTDKALEWLARAVRLPDAGVVYVKTDALMDPFRSNPRFQAIERELRFPD
jgi:hypothetical protein